jgi:2-polyprenyl-3-methyl-5-hydroxy-6-metoxy-1,4-benzoquinol methylase
LIAPLVPGRTFVDVGCMWEVDGDYSFLAAASGATSVTGVDIAAATPQFTTRNAQLGEPVRFVRGDLNDPKIEEWAGTFDVVFCSGVLYHVPNPVFSLYQLRRLCREVLILTSATMPERDVPNAACCYPAWAITNGRGSSIGPATVSRASIRRSSARAATRTGSGFRHPAACGRWSSSRRSRSPTSTRPGA